MKQTAASSRKNAPPLREVFFEFYGPQASKVELASTFNGWTPSKNPLAKGSGGRWTLSLPLAPGQYEYRFLVDGTWQNDQRPVKCVPNAFGTWNCVVEVA